MNGARRGFTLVEVIVALVVTAAALTVLAQGIFSAGRASSAARNVTRAALVAGRVVAEFEAGERAADRAAEGRFEDEPEFAWEARPETYEPGLVLLTIVVRWEERGQERTLAVTRLLRERTQAP
ncbi:MAG TPA: prepilin-type N-terminal cleavage/methylation domain-containing protein [Planctomycetota bacterium]|nr:prepilin-type N-terminal cleavage/methylation domain-containing protein [Planctomycetota bacterium]